MDRGVTTKVRQWAVGVVVAVWVLLAALADTARAVTTITGPLAVTAAGYTLAEDVTVTGDVTVSGGVLDVNGHTLTVGGKLTVSGSNGRLKMVQATDAVTVAGAVTFNGAATVNAFANPDVEYMSAGVLTVAGNFTQTGSVYGNSSDFEANHDNNQYSFRATGTHKVVLNGSAAQTVSFQSPGESRFQNLEILNTTTNGVAFTFAPQNTANIYSTVQVAGQDPVLGGSPVAWRPWASFGDLGAHTALAGGDLDKDGDIDLVAGDQDGTIKLFRSPMADGKRGRFAAARAFNGGSFVTVPDSDPLRLGGVFTVEFWMQVNSIDEEWTGLVGKGNAATAHNYHVWLQHSSRSLQFSYANAAGAEVLINTPANSVKLGRWQHVAAVLDAAQDLMKVYIDGKEQASGTPLGVPATNNTPLWMGRNLDNNANGYLHGMLDEIRLSDTVRYPAPFVPAAAAFTPDEHTMALWHCDEMGGFVNGDAGPNGADGVVTWPKAVEANFAGVDVGDDVRPALADIDGDGDLDLFAGSAAGNIWLAENNGTPEQPAWKTAVKLTDANGGLIAQEYQTSPALVDIDGDGDLDLFAGHKGAGNNNATLAYFQNTGTPGKPVWSLISSSYEVTSLVSAGVSKAIAWGNQTIDPQFGDVDRDGDSDLLLGRGDGTLLMFPNLGTAAAPYWSLPLPYGGQDFGDASVPLLVSANPGGTPDLLVGNGAGAVTVAGNASLERLRINGPMAPATNTTAATLAIDATGLTLSAYAVTNTPDAPADQAPAWVILNTPTADLQVSGLAHTLTQGEGVKRVYLWLKDGAGNLLNTSLDTILLDQGKPTATLALVDCASGVAFPGNTSYTADVCLALAAADGQGAGVSGIRFSNDGTNWSAPEGYAPLIAYALPSGQGARTVHAQVQDWAGNWSETITASVQLDVPLPEILAPAEGDTITFYQDVVNAYPLTLKQTGPNYTYFYALDQAAQALGMTIGANGMLVWTPEAKGDYPVTVTVTNPAGDQAVRSFTIKTAFPTYEAIGNSDPQNLTAKEATMLAAKNLQGDLLGGQTDYHKIKLTAPAMATFALGTQGGSSYLVTILGEDYQKVSYGAFTVKGAAGQTVYNTLSLQLAAGTYFVKVSGQQGYVANDSYSLWYTTAELQAGYENEINNTIAQADSIPKSFDSGQNLEQWQPVTGAITQTGDADLYTLQVEVTAALNIGLATTGSTGSYHLALMVQESEIDGMDIANGIDKAIPVNLFPGTYYLKVTGTDVTPQDLYTITIAQDTSAGNLEIEPNNGTGFANSVTPGTPLDGRLSSKNDTDYYAVHFAEDGSMLLGFTPLTNVAYTVNIYNSENATPVFTTQVKELQALSKGLSMFKGDYFIAITATAEGYYTLDLDGEFSEYKELLDLAIVEKGSSAGTITLAALASYSDGAVADISTEVQWSSLDPDIATVAAGVVTNLKTGTVTVTASYLGKTTSYSTGVEQSYGNMIIVAGGGLEAANKLKDSTQALCDLAYQKFRGRGFEDNDIYYMNPIAYKDLDGNGYNDGIVDNTTVNKAAFGKAIQEWATQAPSTGPLYIYLNDHGAKSQFQLAPGQILTATMLNDFLDAFQAATGRTVVVIIEACHSGSFTQGLSAPNRVVLTSTDQDVAYIGSFGVPSFSQFLFTELYKEGNIGAAYANTKAALSSLNTPFNTQYPQAEDPGKMMNSMYVVGNFALAPVFPEVVAESIQLPASYAIGATPFSIAAQITGLDEGGSAWATIKPVGYMPPAVGVEFETPEVQVPIVPLKDEDGNGSFDGIFQGSYAGFTYNGAYEVIIYARDQEGNTTKSALHTVTVSSGQANSAPTAGFTLAPAAPAANEAVAFSDSSTDADGSVSYWSWEFGDGQGSQAKDPSHAYANGGAYNVTLTVTDNLGASNSYSSQVTVSGGSGAATVTLGVESGWNLLSSAIGFDATAKLGNGDLYLSVWKWANNTWAVSLPGGDTAGYAGSKNFGILTTIGPGEGFWVNSKGAAEVTISGTPGSGGLLLSQGWNLVGLKGVQSQAVATLLTGQTGIISLWKWEGNSWAVYLPDQGDKGAGYAASKGFTLLQEIGPGEGFWVNSSAETTLP